MNDLSMLNSLWVVIAATLVFLMQPGFMCLESGLTRSKNSINVAVKNLTDFIVSVLTFWCLGYGMMFGLSHAGVLGTSQFFVSFETNETSATFFFFQAMFCGTATTIFSGAVAERMKFSSYLLIVVLLSTLVYPIFGHWAWSGLESGNPTGWLGKLGFVDFAGSTVVHSIGGWVALATLIIIGPRAHRFSEENAFFGFNGSNLPLSVLGTCLLWIGWIGFNGGSTLIMNESVPKIIVYTVLAGAAGALSNLLIGYILTKVPRVTFLINGSLGGLVAITACCHCVGAPSAVLIGGIGGLICFAVEIALIKLEIDDAVGAVPVHLGCGIWGTIAVAVFGDPELIGTGLGFWNQLLVQLLGIGTAFVMAFVIPLFLIGRINKFFPLRVSKEDEHNGLNFSEHGATTELVDLCRAMDAQAQTKDISIRMPVEPFTEVGMIAARHNQVMESLEAALSHTDAVVSLAKDAIVTFVNGSLEVININPSGRVMFGLSGGALQEPFRLSDFFEPSDFDSIKFPLWQGKTIETVGKKRCGTLFPMQAVITEAGHGDNSFCIGTFRDITELKERERSLKQSELRYRELFENIGVATLMIDSDTTLVMVNREAEELFGYSREAMEQKKMSFMELLPADEKDRLYNFHVKRRANPSQVPSAYDSKVLDRYGNVKPVYLNISRIAGSDHTVATVMDLSELRRAQDGFNKQKAYFQQLFEGTAQAIVALDTRQRVVSLNQGFEKLFGYSEDELKGQTLAEFIVPGEYDDEFFTMEKAIRSGELVKKETMRRTSTGTLIPVSVLSFPVKIKDQLEGFFYIYEDITERKEFENQLFKQAFYDGLTKIPNRILFFERVERALERRKRKSDYNYAVMLLDLDRFKWVNDSLGHLAGDDLLQRIAKRFLSCVRTGDTVARLGGDEFAVLLEDYGKSSKVIEIANRLQQEAQRPLLIGNTDVHVSASIGIILNTGNYLTTEAILRDADIAMYRAKELGKARFQIFNRKLHELASQALQLENELREGIHSNELLLFYQPIIDIQTRSLVAFEALVRWDHPRLGIVSPNTFIPIAEETGLIIGLGEWVLREACKQMQRWRAIHPKVAGIKINVNLSAKQFLQKDLGQFVRNTLEKTGLDPSLLKLEITESAIMEGGNKTVDLLGDLQKIGIKLAIDDFGTGYSSLSSLQQFPINDLKIDRSFVKELAAQEESKEIVRTIIALAHTLNLGLVAEGVETEEQFNILKELKCDCAQGYLFSKPLPVGNVEGVLDKYIP